MIETWENIKGYEGYYVISSSGIVKSLDRRVYESRVGERRIKGVILRPHTNRFGYVYVQLWKNKKGVNFLVHRLLAETFIENPLLKSDVNHKNGVRNDNRLDNLEWATRSENVLHGYRENGRKPAKYWLGKGGKNHPLRKSVKCLNSGEVFDSIALAADKLKITPGEISSVCAGKRSHARTFKFQYV